MAFLKKVSFENFKGFQNVVLDGCGKINVVFGKNNSGKSTVLHGIDVGCNLIKYRDLGRHKLVRNIKDLFPVEENSRFEFVYEDGQKIEMEIVKDEHGNFNPKITSTEEEYKKTPVLILPESQLGLMKNITHSPRQIMNLVRGGDFVNLNALAMLHALKKYGQEGEDGFKNSDYKILINEIKKFFPELQDLESSKNLDNQHTLKYLEYGKTLDILYSGNGLKSLIDILVKQTLSNANIVLLDEPEQGLHPDLQRKLIDFLILLSKEKDVQVFLSTHSPIFLNYLEETTLWKAKNIKGTRTVEKIDPSTCETLISDIGIRPSDLFNRDMCLMVEGRDDVIFWEHVIFNLYAKEFSNVAVGVIQYGGGAAEAIIRGHIDVTNLVPGQKNLLWLRDRDSKPTAQPSQNSRKFKNKLESQNQKVHVLEKRELEYYFPKSLIVEAQQGDSTKVKKAVKILESKQTKKFKKVAKLNQICVPGGKYLKRLLPKHIKNKTDLDPELKELIRKELYPLRNSILGI